MIENYRSGFIWQLMRSCPYIVAGLRRAGFSGGWLRNYAQHLPTCFLPSFGDAPLAT
jgi:hypothetical protein